MKRILILLGSLLLSLSVLAACSSNSNPNEQSGTNNGKVDDKEDTNEANQTDENTKDEKPNNDDKKNEADTSAGNFSDQKDLKIGDSGEVESTIGKYKVTVNSVKMMDEIDGKAPSLDHFFITEMTIENIGDKPYDVVDIVDNLEFTKDLDGGGAGDFSKFHDSIKHFEGTLEPGDTVTGEAVYQGQDAETYYIRTKDGLISAGAVKNQTIWTFDKSEAEQ